MDSPASVSSPLVALNATPHAHAAEFITAILILGAGALVVIVAIVVGRRLERRAVSEGFSAAGERRAGLDERRAAHRAGDAVYRRLEQRGNLLVVDDAFTASVAIAPWHAAPAGDLGEVAGGRRVTSHAWSAHESDELLDRFRNGFELDALADEIGVAPCAAVEELARRAFGATEPVADPGARRFGKPWTAAELRTLHSAWTAGLRLPDIARQLGRDQLSTVFRLLESAADAREAAGAVAVAADDASRIRSGLSVRG